MDKSIRRFLGATWAAAALLLAACASKATHFGSADVSIDVVSHGQPAAKQRFIVWIGEQRHELLTDAHGHIELTEDYAWDGQSFTFPPVGTLRHSPPPTIDINLDDAPGVPLKVTRTDTRAPNDSWKVHLRVNLDERP